MIEINFSGSLSSHSLFYAEECTEFAGPSPHHCAWAFEELFAAVASLGNTVSDWTSRRFEPQTSCSRDERAIARSTLTVDFNFAVVVESCTALYVFLSLLR